MDKIAVELTSVVATCSEGDPDYEEIRFFRLKGEDADLLGSQLKSTLVPSQQLEIVGDLGEGAFGRVHKGILTRCPNSGTVEKITVAVKTIKNCASYTELKGFLLESTLMSTFHHPHVLGLIGVSLNNSFSSPYLVLPFMENGDLRTFLKNKRDIAMSATDSSFPEGIKYAMLVVMCCQIASGMEYLAIRKLVHRDLAARNCMIDAQLSVKVADFGLTRDIYQTDYYRQSHQGRVPVKWMSPESLHDKISNEKTDAWSYGVTCWEVFSLGRMPYPAIANYEMEEYLDQGHRLKQPALCSNEMYDLMQLCWNEDPNKRLTFSEMVKKYDGILPDVEETQEANEEKNSSSDKHSIPPDTFEFNAAKEPKPSDSLFTSIIAHLEQTPSQLADTLLCVKDAEYAQMQQPSPPNGISCSNIQLPVHAEEYEPTEDNSHEYDATPDHVTASNDHVTSSADHMISCKQTSDDRLDSDYVFMRPASSIKT